MDNAAARRAIERRLEGAQAALADTLWRDAAAAVAADLDALRERWDTLAIDRQRTAITGVVERVTVGPAERGRNRCDPDRIHIDWRR